VVLRLGHFDSLERVFSPVREPARSHNVSDHCPDNSDGMVVLFEERFGIAGSRPARPSAA
jgi:hypothetical protein